MLKENLDELQQTINLMQSDNQEEFFDISTRNKKYGRVDALNGPLLLEKYDNVSPAHNLIAANTQSRLTPVTQTSGRNAPLSNLSSRFAMMK